MSEYSEKVIILKEVKNPKISVIIPTYNEEKYIEDTLLSIRYQDFKQPYEIIVSDSNSNDRTVEIAKKYADKIIITRKRGIALGRNLGAKYASSNILLFVDADSLLIPNTLKEFYKTMRKKDVVAATAPFFSREYSNLANFYFSVSYGYIKFLYNVSKVAQIPGSLICCKKEAFERINGFNEKLKVLEDFDFTQRISKLGKIDFVETTFYLTSSRRIKKWGIKAVPKYLGTYLYYLFFKSDELGKKFWNPVR